MRYLFLLVLNDYEQYNKVRRGKKGFSLVSFAFYGTVIFGTTVEVLSVHEQSGRLSQKSCPVFYSVFSIKIGHELLDIQY